MKPVILFVKTCISGFFYPIFGCTKEVLVMKRKPTLIETISCFVVMILIIGIGKGIMKLDIQPLLLLAAFYAALIGLRLGYTYQEMEKV